MVENPDDEIAWDDRQTEVQWKKYHDASTNDDLLKKIVEPTVESIHNIVPGTTKILQLLLNVIVAYSEYSCIVEEIFFKDTLMYQVINIIHRINIRFVIHISRLISFYRERKRKERE